MLWNWKVRNATKPDRKAVSTERFRILGNVGMPHFSTWIEGHALRLGLCGKIVSHDEYCVEVIVAGPPELIDAMALACSLGPIEVWVEAIEREYR